jgi:hypothetical protein
MEDDQEYNIDWHENVAELDSRRPMNSNPRIFHMLGASQNHDNDHCISDPHLQCYIDMAEEGSNGKLERQPLRYYTRSEKVTTC